MLASIINVSHIGYPLLFLIVMAESSGVPVPGETGLIAAAVLASKGTLTIELVIPIAAAGAIVGDNIGYLIGRRGGRWLLERPGRYQQQRRQAPRTCRGAPSCSGTPAEESAGRRLSACSPTTSAMRPETLSRPSACSAS